MAKTTKEWQAGRRERAIRAFVEVKASRNLTDWKTAEFVARRLGWSAVGLRRVLVNEGLYKMKK